MQCIPVLQSLIPGQGDWNGKSQPGQRGSGVPAGSLELTQARCGAVRLGAELYCTLLREKQMGHPWKWIVSASQKRDMEQPVKNSEVIFKNIFPFPTCMLGG